MTGKAWDHWPDTLG